MQPQANNQAQASGQSALTLAQLNTLLNEAGFPFINPKIATALQQLASRDRIISAVMKANDDPSARDFLLKLFNDVGVPVGQGSGYQQGQQQSQQQGQQQGQPQPNTSQDAQYAHEYEYSPQPGHHQGDTGTTPDTGSTPRVAEEDRLSVHVYGGKAALCFEADKTKAGFDTVALDAAASSGPRQYNWGNKVRIQLTRGELPVVAAVLIGALPSCEFKSHGPNKDKGFSIERQAGGKVFIKVMAANEGVKAVPVMASDIFYVTSLFLRQIQKSHPWLDGPSVMALVRATQALN